MNEIEFIKEAENFIYKEVAKNTNLLLGKNKTSGLSTGLFLKLPIVIRLEKTANDLPKLLKPLNIFFQYFGAYVELSNTASVYFTFVYRDEKDLKALMNHLKYRSVFFAFVYLHEVQHIIRKHNTTSYDTLMTRVAKDIQQPHAIINIAQDHAINYSLKDLFKLSPLSKDWAEIEQEVMYSYDYHEKQLSDIEILKLLIKGERKTSTSPVSNSLEKVSFGSKESLQPIKQTATGKPGGTSKQGKISTASDDADISAADLADSMQDIIKNATRGTAAGDLMEELFSSIKVETGWFKKIKAAFKRQVYYKTHDYSTSWSSLNNTYRKIYKSPKKFFFDDKVNIVLSIDHSGSMATEDLQKLLYLIESESTKIDKLTVLIHDTRVAKAFSIENEYDIASSPEFKDALSTRYVSGGTSHACVFECIEEMKIPDPNKVIYMSFSDNMSDIEQTVHNYPIMRKITKYWICAGANRPVKVPGVNIMMV